jgi:transcriptional regulator with XRE-family HTH domain
MFSHLFLWIRAESGMTQCELAIRLGVSQSLVSKLEDQILNPDILVFLRARTIARESAPSVLPLFDEIYLLEAAA